MPLATPLLVEISPPALDVDLDLRYATADNLTGRPIYRRAAAYLVPEGAERLGRAVGLAAAQGLRLRVFDAFRPVEAQWALWNALPDPDFIADPRRGSNHGRGAAIDLTLADKAGRPLDMGTGFDDPVPQSHHARTDVPVEAQRNRLLLLGIMASAGWQPNPLEWWHYNLPAPQRYPLLADSALAVGLM